MAKKKKKIQKTTNNSDLLDYAETVVKLGGFEEEDAIIQKRLTNLKELLKKKQSH